MKTKLTPGKCLHQNFLTHARAFAQSKDGKITGYRLCITAKCSDCGLPFHFPNYAPNDKEEVMACASVSRKGAMLITPVAPGLFAPQLN